VPIDPQPDWVLTQRRVIGDRLRDARLKAKLSQWELAERVGIDHKTVHRVERGTSDPSVGLLLQLARALGVPASDVLAGLTE
jgi:transcriptional regulator with XRE-family HTH domain